MADPLSDWPRENTPALLASFGDPIGDEALATTTEFFGRPLPEDYVRFLRAHDGHTLKWLFGG